MRGSLWSAPILAGMVLAGTVSCSSYRFVKDPTPEIENSRQEYVVNNPGNRFNDDIAAGRVRRGMSRLQVRVAWGDPDQVAPNRDRTAEVWAYEEPEAARGTSVYLLHFEGELLTHVDVERGDTLLPTSDVEREASERRPPASGSERTGKKPDGR